MDSLSTQDENDDDVERRPSFAEGLALAITWSAEGPWQVGQMAWLPAGAPGESRVFGRGGPLADDPYPRLRFARYRPIGPEAVAPLSLPRISRIQLVASAHGQDHVSVRNVGRCPLLIGGRAVEHARLSPGDTAQLGQQLLLLCVRRDVALRAPPDEYPLRSFGAPDGLGIVGESAAIWKLRHQLAVVGPRSGHVLLLGPSGSGKELSARAVHALSSRSARPLVARNAATIPESLIDAELFGNARNYPNPGMAERPGLVGEADNGTLFLDEIAELSPTMQGHLLRVLDGGEYHRLGESVARRSDLRVIAATNRCVSHLKDDLLARFTYRIELPDLNARREDIPLLATHLFRQFAQSDPQWTDSATKHALTSTAIPIRLCRRLVEHTYTAHLRELERLLLQALVEGEADSGGHSRLADETALSAGDIAIDNGENAVPLTPERVQAVLDQHNGRIETAYRALGLKNRFMLGRLIAKHGLEVRRRRSRRVVGAKSD